MDVIISTNTSKSINSLIIFEACIVRFSQNFKLQLFIIKAYSMDAILSMPWLYAELAADDINARDGNPSNKEDNISQREAMQIGRLLI